MLQKPSNGNLLAIYRILRIISLLFFKSLSIMRIDYSHLSLVMVSITAQKNDEMYFAAMVIEWNIPNL